MGCGASQQSVKNVNPLGVDMYERKELIGVGHHGRVYRCVHQRDKKEYAIKVIDQLQNQPNYDIFKSRYLQFMPRLKELIHPKIMSFLHFQLSQKELSLVMELSKEGSLKKGLQKQGKYLEQHVAQITGQIVEGVNFLHSNGVTHGDLKTGNVFFFGDKTIRIGDYSIAELYDGRMLSKQSQGKAKKQNMFARGDSLPYMAPQVIKTLGFDYKGDIWSIGCIIVEMLTGKVPWINMAPTFQQAFKIICNSKFPPFPQNISNECKGFLQSCLAVNPAKRNTAKQLLSHPFLRSFSKEKQIIMQNKSRLSQKKLQQIDKTNRVQNKKPYNQKSLELKSPAMSEMKYLDQNSESTPSRFVPAKSSQNSRIQRSAKRQVKQSASSKLVGNSFSKDFASVSKEDILPQILQDEQQANVVFLNNKKVKLTSPSAKHLQAKAKTEQSDLVSSRHFRNEIQGEESIERARLGSKDDLLNDSLADINRKMETEPNLMVSQFENNKDYFKKPLKLLKKKINQRNNDASNLSGSFTTNNESSYLSVQKLIKGQKDKNKIRSNTESSRQEIVINTQLAKAERDRYINQQLVIKKQRQEDKLQWEKELKKEAEFLKKELSHRYAYPYTSIPL